MGPLKKPSCESAPTAISANFPLNRAGRPPSADGFLPWPDFFNRPTARILHVFDKIPKTGPMGLLKKSGFSS